MLAPVMTIFSPYVLFFCPGCRSQCIVHVGELSVIEITLYRAQQRGSLL